MSKVILSGYIIVPEAELEAVTAELPGHISNTKNEPGCLIFEVAQRTTHLNIFDVYEEFIDSEAFSMHQTRVKNSRWGQITKNVERHYKIRDESDT